MSSKPMGQGNNKLIVNQLYAWLSHPVHAGTLCTFRLVYGLVMVAQIYKWMYAFPLFEESIYTFPYAGFGWVKPLQPSMANALLFICLLFSSCMSIGLCTRFSAIMTYVTFAYLFHMCESLHNNHYVLMCHVNFVGIFLNWGEWASVDSLLKSWKRQMKKKVKGGMVVIPRWNLLLMQLLFCIPYFFGSIAKMNRDWVFRAQPIKMWFSQKEGWLFHYEWAPWFICYSGLLFDLVISFLLFWKKTRYFLGFPAAIFFNVSNKIMFNIGVFPYAMICSLVLFLDPHTPASIYSWFSRSPPPIVPPDFKGKPIFDDLFPGKLPWSRQSKLYKSFVLTFVGGFVLIHALFPLRHFALYKSNPSWTEEGHLGAWHMKLRSKHGWFYVSAHEANGNSTILAPALDPLMTRKQHRDAESRPHAMLVYVKRLNQVFQEASRPLTGIRVKSCFSLNANPMKELYIPTVNMLDYIEKYEVIGTTGVGKFLYAFEEAPLCGDQPDPISSPAASQQIRANFVDLYESAHFRQTPIPDKFITSKNRVLHERVDASTGRRMVEYGLTWNT